MERRAKSVGTSKSVKSKTNKSKSNKSKTNKGASSKGAMDDDVIGGGDHMNLTGRFSGVDHASGKNCAALYY